MPNYAVLTGDIIKSSQLPDGGLSRIFENLQTAADLLTAWQGQPAFLTRNRGDGWQMVATPDMALRTMFIARAAVRMTDKRFDTRVALSIGAGTIDGTDLADAAGPAFTASGQALETMPKRRSFAVDPSGGTTDAILRLSEEIIGRWTDTQAAIALSALNPSRPTQSELAAHFGISQQAIQQTIDAAGIDCLLDVCEIIDG